MTDKKQASLAGMGQLKAGVPKATEQWFRDKAAREGIPMQSLIAPILNAVARGEITGGFSYTPDPHGNAHK